MLEKLEQYMRRWLRVQQDLDVEICVDLTLLLADQVRLRVPVLVPEFGAEKGMVVVPEYQMIENQVSSLIQGGYGFSVIGYSMQDAVCPVDSYVEMLLDWGWSGKAEERPAWLSDGA